MYVQYYLVQELKQNVLPYFSSIFNITLYKEAYVGYFTILFSHFTVYNIILYKGAYIGCFTILFIYFYIVLYYLIYRSLCRMYYHPIHLSLQCTILPCVQEPMQDVLPSFSLIFAVYNITILLCILEPIQDVYNITLVYRSLCRMIYHPYQLFLQCTILPCIQEPMQDVLPAFSSIFTLYNIPLYIGA